jgi:hypothetical protein
MFSIAAMGQNRMFQCQTLNPAQLFSVLKVACSEQAPVTVTFLTEGKWHLMKLSIRRLTDERVVLSGVNQPMSIYQPVGICITFGHNKYLFDSQVVDIETGSSDATISIDYPQAAESMPRRACLRQPVPGSMHVKVLFWHRGFIDASQQQPAEQYWQGRLLNLSAGGAQFEIDNDQKHCFSTNQLLGIQFTPMSYQLPFLLESHVRYLKDCIENGHFKIGVEFLGLETPEGRQLLHRLLEVIDEYERMNQADKSAAAS